MSVSAFGTQIAVPSIPGLVSDVTPLVVDSLPLPAMRSLAKTSTHWAQYLQEEWQLHQRNCADSAEKIKSQKYPDLKLVDVASKLAHARSIADARKFLNDFPFVIADSSVPVLATVLGARIDHKPTRSLQYSLEGHQGWDRINDLKKVIQKIDALVKYCEKSFTDGRIRFDEILEVIASLEDRPKSYAFTRLIQHLCLFQKFHQDSGKFWKQSDGPNDFIFIAKYLLPKKWNRSLALDREIPIPGFAPARTASFVCAAMISLKQLGRHSPGFGAALLRLVITSADKYSPGCRTWKIILATATDPDAKSEIQAMSDLILAVFCLGMPNAKAKNRCKEILVGSGFFSNGDWTRFKHYAPKWAKKVNLVGGTSQ
jgi:hypothetical protein